MDSSFFGLHDGTNLSFNYLNVGAVRLWDVGVTWKAIETSPGIFNWTKFDSLVNAAVAEGAAITYVLGQVPSFYALAPTATPPLDKWEAYVRAVATRYKGRISHYQIWNEANSTNFFTGTTADMARMTKVAALAINSTDPAALVVAPSGPIRLAYMRNWYTDYYNEIVDGYHPWRWINAMGFSMYPLIDLGPEAMLDMMKKMSVLLVNVGVPSNKMIIHTSEINYDVETGTVPTLLSDVDQAAWTMRTYLVGAIGGFERVHWYRYDWGYDNGQPLANVYWTDPVDHDIVTVAGNAFNTIKNWMRPTFNGYTVNANGTYLANFGTKTIAWNPTMLDSVSGFDGLTKTKYDGSTNVISGKVNVGTTPVLLS